MHTKFAAIAVDAVVAYSCTTYSAWVLPELCKRSRPVPQIMTFVFPAFTLNPFFSMASFHIKSLLTHSSRESAMMTRSSAYRSSQGTPARNSRDKASSTMLKSKGLSTDPWWTPTYTSNSLLKPSPTRTRLRALAYIPWTISTIHSSTPSFLRAHQITFRGTRSNAFSRSTKDHIKPLVHC